MTTPTPTPTPTAATITRAGASRRPRWRVLLPLVLAVLVLSLASCGRGESDGGLQGSTTTRAPGSSSDEPPEFPVTVHADQGQVTIEAEPQRIVSLSASLTEWIYAIGAGDQVVAVDRYSDHPKGTPVTDLSGFEPNIEAIAGYRPDLVLLSKDQEGLVDALTNLRIPVLVLGSPQNIDEVLGQVEVLGDATGHPEEASDAGADLAHGLDELAAEAPDRARPLRYYLEISDTHHSVTSDTFIGQVLERAGLASIADGGDPAAGGYPQLSSEAIVAADPEVIFLDYTKNPPDAASVAARPGWSGVAAVAGGHIVTLDADVASRWGPRLVELLQAVLDATRDVPSP